MEPVVSVRGLRKAYGAVEAVRGLDLEVAAGEVFAFLGPNGAGRRRPSRSSRGIAARDAGEVSVLGFDPAANARVSGPASGSCCRSPRSSRVC